MKIEDPLERAKEIDLELFRKVNNKVLRWKAINPFMRIVARFGPLLFLINFVIFLVLPHTERRRVQKKVNQALVGTALVYLINTPLRRMIQRPRPYFKHLDVYRLDPVHHQPSMPSDHATVSFAIARAFRRAPLVLRIPTYLIAGLISFARVYSGEHYPSDVVVGAAIGMVLEEQVVHYWPVIEEKIEEVAERV